MSEPVPVAPRDIVERPKWKEHDRIWLSPACNEVSGCASERTWCQDDTGPCDECGLDSVEFVRADIREAEIERLREERDRAALSQSSREKPIAKDRETKRNEGDWLA